MPGPSKPDPRRPVWSLARVLVRMTLTVVDRGAALARSSTRGLQEIYEEARDEYEAEKAAAHSARVSPIAEPMPGSVVQRVVVPDAGGRRSRKSANGTLTEQAARPAPGRPRKSADGSPPSKARTRRRAEDAGVGDSAPDAPRRGRGRPRREESAAEPAVTGRRSSRKSTAAAGASGRRRTGKTAGGTSAPVAGDRSSTNNEPPPTEAHASEGGAG